MPDTIKKQQGVFKNRSSKNWLRKAAIRATSFIMILFVLNSCTKEQRDDVIGKVPGGGLSSTPDQWYYLEVTYKNKFGNPMESRVGPYFEYMVVWGSYKFKLHPGENGFNYLQLEDSSWMTLSFSGWAYHSTEGDRVGWKIVDGKLYTDYTRWKDYPLACQWGSNIFGFEAYYVGVNLWGQYQSDYYVMTDCKFVPYP